jgi:hypothetical protein
MIGVHLSFSREKGVAFVSSSAPVSKDLNELLLIKSLPRGIPPDESLKSFPVLAKGSAVSLFKVQGETGFGVVLVFPEQRDIDPFQYESAIKKALWGGKGEKIIDGLAADKDERADAPIPNIPQRFESAVHSLLVGEKIMVTGDKDSVKDMIKFVLSLIPRAFHGYYGVTTWCNSPAEDENIVGLPAGLFDKVMPLLEVGGTVGALIDLPRSSTFGRGSTSFSKSIADYIANGDISHARKRIENVFNDAVKVPNLRKDAEKEEKEAAILIAKGFFGYGDKTEQKTWLDTF